MLQPLPFSHEVYLRFGAVDGFQPGYPQFPVTWVTLPGRRLQGAPIEKSRNQTAEDFTVVMCNQFMGAAAEPGIAAIIARVRDGDQAAARELVEHVRPIVTRITRARQPRRTPAEDIMQDIYLKIFTRLGQYRGDAPFENWVARIASTTCLDQLRAQRCRPELRFADLAEGEALFLETTRSDPSALLPGRALAIRELLHRLLDRLQPDDRGLIVWFELEDRSIGEIAAMTGWNFAFIKMRLFRARRKLQRFLANLGGFDGVADSPPGTARWHRGERNGGGTVKTRHRAGLPPGGTVMFSDPSKHPGG